MNEKALLVVSFGTSHPETKEKTIEAIENDLAAAFPDRRLYRAWTSSMLRRMSASLRKVYFRLKVKFHSTLSTSETR